MRATVFQSLLPLLFTSLPAVQPPPNPAQPPRDPNGQAYVNTSFEADEALARAAKLEAEHRWSDAAAALQDIAERFGDHLTQLDKHRYVSVRGWVNRHVAAWPRAGVDAYRAIFEARAREALARLAGQREVEPLVTLAQRYYPTRAAAGAIDRAAELAIESGDFAAARQWYGRLLTDHPDRDRLQWPWRAKLALCAAWEGDAARSRTLSRSLPPDQPDTRVKWAGVEQPLADFVRRALAQAEQSPPPPKPLSAGAGLFGGGPARRGFFQSDGRADAVLWRAADVARAVDGRDDTDAVPTEAARHGLQSGRGLSRSPVAGGGLVFVHDNRSVWAVDPAAPDTPAWRYGLADAALPDAHWLSEEELPPLYTTTFAGGRLYVHLDREPPSSIDGNTGESSTIVCLEAKTGREIWRNDLVGFASEFEETRIDGAPLLHRGRLFALVRRRKPFGFEACFLLDLDPRTGRIVRSVHLGEAPTGSYGYRRPTLSHPAARGDRVFAQTNLGTVAAVSASTGRVAWLYRYRSRLTDDAEGSWPARTGRTMRSWQYNPTMLWKDRVVCAPLDIDAILILDQADGRLIHRIPATQIHTPDYILGIHGRLLYAVGSQVTAWDLENHELAWARPLAQGQPLGRGAVTPAGLLIPTTRGLLRYALDGGPARIHHWPLRSAGNVIALPDQIIVAATDTLFGLVGKDEAFARLARQMDHAPADPRPALRLAELAFSTGEYDRGLAATDRAVARAGGFAQLTDSDLRARFFDRLMHFADVLLEASGEPDPAAPKIDTHLDDAVSLLRKAGQCAPDPRAQVTYRLKLAAAFARQRDFSRAVETYQQILCDRGLRRLRIEVSDAERPSGRPDQRTIPEGAGGTSAGTLAQLWIDRLLADFGRDTYAAVERRAAERLKIAVAARDPDAMLAVADAFPNARAAADAVLAHARFMRDAGRSDDAARSYRRLLRRRPPTRVDREPPPVDRPAILREFTACLVQAGRLEVAAQWLDRAVRDYADRRFEYQGRFIGFRDYRRALLGNAAARGAALPDMTWPVTGKYTRLYSDTVAVLDPVFERLPATRWDTVLVYAGGSLDFRDAAADRALWPDRVPCRTQPELLGMTRDRLILTTGDRIFALARDTGRLAWQIGEVRPLDPDADPEWSPAWNSRAMTPTRLYAANDRRDLVCIDLADGNLRWHVGDGPRTGSTLVADPRFVAYTTWKGLGNGVVICDADTGHVLHTVPLAKNRPIQDLRFTPDGNLVVIMANELIGLDPAGGATLWKIDSRDNFLLATLQIDPEGLFVSSDGRTLTKYDLADGRVTWSTPPIGRDKREGLWAHCAGGVLYAASADALMAFDTADGQLLWEAADPPGLREQAPRLLTDTVVSVTRTDPKPPKAGRPPPAPARRQCFCIRRYQRDTGREPPSRDDKSLMLDNLRSFGGLFPRDRCLIVVDGNRLIGYVGPRR